MGTKGGPAHTTPLHQLGQKVALEEEGKFVRQLAHKTRLDIDVCDLKSLPVAADIRPALESGIVATVGSTTRQTIEFLELMNLFFSSVLVFSALNFLWAAFLFDLRFFK